ncbi:MAG: LD-carboxypeptidase [Bacteroidales bacterium]|nr:LD-carboxypeptidase [Bacteroidales bacterium]
MKKPSLLPMILLLAGALSCSPADKPDIEAPSGCKRPDYLSEGDKVALISPSYYTPMENVDAAAEVLRGWGFDPVVGPNVGKITDGQYAGTADERAADVRWALEDPAIKAIICNRGGYGSIHLIDKIDPALLKAHPKWIVGFSDITTLHGLWTRAGVMSVHGTMCSFLAAGGADSTSTLMRDILLGKMPEYELPPHPQNITGRASGTLVGGNLCTFVPNLGTQADAAALKDIILFVEEVEESMHNVDRQFRIMEMNGVLERCKGVILGEFTDCGSEFTFGSCEEMLRPLLAKYGIPVLCGFPAGHGDVNLPLVMGAPVTIDVRPDGSTLHFNID